MPVKTSLLPKLGDRIGELLSMTAVVNGICDANYEKN